MQQRSDEWFQSRLGKVTASRAADILAKTKTGWSDRRKKYLLTLVSERLSGQLPAEIVSPRMMRGIEMEIIGRAEYEIRTGYEVSFVGLVDHPTIPYFAASPDGLVGNDGLIEIKCPDTITHISTIQTHTINPDYIIQIQSQMACTGRKWCDFVSYDDRVPGEARFFCKRVLRDEKFIHMLEKEVQSFLAECAAVEDEIRQYKWQRKRPKENKK